MSMLAFLILLSFSTVFIRSANQCAAQILRPNGENADQLDPVEPGNDEFQERKKKECRTIFRTFDGTCTNNQNKLWASAGTPHYSYVHQSSSKTPTGHGLPSPRLISNVLSTQTTDIFNARGMSELVVYFAQFLDHTIVATASNELESMPIPIPSYDPIFQNFTKGELPFQRSVRGIVPNSGGAERPVNLLSSAIDLATLYSSNQDRINALRAFKDGQMKTSEGNMLPLNTEGLVNAPTKEAKYYLSGDHRANEHPVLTAFHTLFLREHNLLAKDLKKAFPSWNDWRLFNMARQINIVQFQKITFEEFLPTMTGRRLPKYQGYNEHVNPTLSDIFTTAAYRVGHTMVPNQITRKGPNMSKMPSIPFTKMFFRKTSVLTEGVEPFIRGAIYRKAQEVDVLVSSSIRNHLFTGIPQEKGFDLIALNIQRSRDHAIPSYNTIRKMFGRSRARTFQQITSNLALQSRLATLYGSPDKVEAWVGLMAEDHMRGASMGPTLYRVWRSEFRRIRDGDVFFYKRPNVIPHEVWAKVHRVREIMFESSTMKQIILRNTAIKKSEIRGSVWKGRGT